MKKSNVFSEAERAMIFQESLQGFYQAYTELHSILPLPDELVTQWKEELLSGPIKDGYKFFSKTSEKWVNKTPEGREYRKKWAELKASEDNEILMPEDTHGNDDSDQSGGLGY